MSRRRWFLLVGCVLVAGFIRFNQSAPDQAPETMFSGEPQQRIVVALDETWAKAPVEQILGLSQASDISASPAESPKTSNGDPSNEGWWAEFPRTGSDVYWSFALNPSKVEGSELLRNKLLNPADVQISRVAVQTFLAYYDDQIRLIASARELLAEGRRRLTLDLLAKNQLATVSVESISNQSFKLANGRVVTGEYLLAKARSVLKGGAKSSRSVAVTALSMAGKFGAGDSVTMSGGHAYYLPFSRVEEGLPTLVGLERSVTIDMVVDVHYWFLALGVLPNADELLSKVAPRILEGPR